MTTAQPPAVLDFGVVGGGIVGLAVARQITRTYPDATVAVIEKEADVGRHQTSRNSGVVHAGLYYPSGSLKARLCRSGAERLRDYAASRGIPFDICGKVVVAVEDSELGGLHDIYSRAVANSVPAVRIVDARELRDIEPAARGVAAIHSPTTAITDFGAIARAMRDDVVASGGISLTGSTVVGIRQDDGAVRLDVNGRGPLRARRVVTCAGLWSDRIAAMSGDEPHPQIVPFRGDYYRLRSERTGLVRGLIYPVADPRYPFLGVHLTRTVSGEVLVGPNAVLAFAREGYRLSTVHVRELASTLRYRGFRRMARQHWQYGLAEMRRSLSKRAFAAEARRYLPDLRTDDLVRARGGVRAQAVDPDGGLVDDFRISTVGRVVNVRNAPSPAASSSLAIADDVVRRLDTVI